MKKQNNNIFKYLKLPITLIFLSCFNKSFSQCTIYHEIINENHTKQCQACYKKIKYLYINTKVYWGNCSNRNAYINKVNCMNKVFKATGYSIHLENGGTDEVMRNMELAKSKCTETNSGRHLWKEINLKSEVMLDYRKVNNLKDDYWCDLLEQNLESAIKVDLIISIIEDLNDL